MCFLGGLLLKPSTSLRLNHLYVNGDAGREIEVREGFNHLRRGVHDIYEALVDAHFKLFTRVLVDEG